MAFAWRRIALETSDAGRIKQLLAFQEVLLRTLVAILLPDYLRGEPTDIVEALLPKLARPSQGHQAALIRARRPVSKRNTNMPGNSSVDMSKSSANLTSQPCANASPARPASPLSH